MSFASNRSALLLPLLIAVAMHGLLFALTKSKVGGDVLGVAVPPNTSYLSRSAGQSAMSSVEVRTMLSPVLFSLPSSMGFSAELLATRVRRPRILLNQKKPELFLEVAAAPSENEPSHAAELTLTGGGPTAPPVPLDENQEPANRPAARRVTLSPGLKARVVGGVTLPPELNQEVEKPWEALATVRVSELGVVRHVLLDHPIEPPELNQHVLQLLYGLRFKSGAPMEGSIEIYSPESTAKKNAEVSP